MKLFPELCHAVRVVEEAPNLPEQRDARHLRTPGMATFGRALKLRDPIDRMLGERATAMAAVEREPQIAGIDRQPTTMPG